VVIATNAEAFGLLVGDRANAMVVMSPINVFFLPAFGIKVIEVGGGKCHRWSSSRALSLLLGVVASWLLGVD
jgi:hypothetical protein